MEISSSTKTYKTPQAKMIEVNPRQVLCLSGNGSMYEKDYGDGGFEED